MVETEVIQEDLSTSFVEVDHQTNLPSDLYRLCASLKKIVSENNNYEKYNHFYISPISYLPHEAHFQNTLSFISQVIWKG